MKFEDLLKIALIFASIIQFYLSFVKGRNKKGKYGKILFKLNMDANKRRFLAILLAGVVGYSFYVTIKNNVSTLGIFIVIYFLLSIYDFSKMKIITSEGIGQKSFYSNSYYNFTKWNKVVEWKWCPERQNLLFIKVQQKNKVVNKQWIVLNFEKEAINKIFEENVKNKEFST